MKRDSTGKLFPTICNHCGASLESPGAELRHIHQIMGGRIDEARYQAIDEREGFR